MNITQKDIDRFWSKVDKERSNTFYNGKRCWEWTAHCDKKGYGGFSFHRKFVLAHRASWMIFYGNILDDLCVLHHCDNPPCVNPAHLFLGTNLDNVRDRDKKGRNNQPRGENSGRAKLTFLQVLEIRTRYKRRGIGGETALELAKIFHMSRNAIWNIIKNRNWKAK
jgi:hypothetical protein